MDSHNIKQMKVVPKDNKKTTVVPASKVLRRKRIIGDCSEKPESGGI